MLERLCLLEMSVNGAFIIILMIFFVCYTFDSLFECPLHLKTLRHSRAAAAPLRVIGPLNDTCGFFLK